MLSLIFALACMTDEEEAARTGEDETILSPSPESDHERLNSRFERETSRPALRPVEKDAAKVPQSPVTMRDDEASA